MKGKFVELVRSLRDPVRARRQETIRDVELTWSDHDLANFRVFALGMQPAEMADVCYALADATAVPLLELLVDYAEVNNELLQIAFQSLAHAPLSARLFLAGRLFASEKPLVRASACTMLAGVGSAAASFLVAALDDPSSLVTAAAIRALVRINHVGAGETIVGKLRDRSDDIRSLAIDAMTRLGAHAEAFEIAALDLLRNPGEKPGIRAKAARALEGMRSANGRAALLAMLGDAGCDPEMRATAASTLGGFADAEVVNALLRTARGEMPALAKAARRSLAGMKPEATLPALDQSLRGGDAALAMVAAELLGGMGSHEAGVALADCLQAETRPPVLAAIADALGRSGNAGAWKALLRKLRDNPGSLPLLAALADAASVDRLEEFAVLLDSLPESGAGELVLRRLAAFSHTVKPSPAVLRRAVDVLDSGNRGLAMPAVEILAYSGDPAIRDRLLTEMAALGPALPARRLLRVMLSFCRGELSTLFANVGPAASRLVVDAAAEAESLGGDGADFLVTLASWVRSGAGCAAEGLAAAAALDPAQLIAAMRASPDRVFLLEAWAELPPRERARHYPDLDGLFAACGAHDRLTALDILSRLEDERHLGPVSMLAFGDREAPIRAAAASLVRRMALRENPAVETV